MRDRERRQRVWAILDQKEAEIAELRAKVRNAGLTQLLDVALGNLRFCRQVLSNSTEVFKYPGADEDERRLFDAVDLFVRVASNQIERVRSVLQEFGPDASPI